MAWYDANSSNSTHIVGAKDANELDLYDMTGNVYEWCNDWYASNYYDSSPSNNPQGPSSGSFRIIRGGCYDNSSFYCRVKDRSYDGPTGSSWVLGFRPVFP